MEGIENGESFQFNFSTNRDATDNFSDASKLGKGGFGAVYKGVLSDGQQIGVKRMSMNSKKGDLEFQKEVLQYVVLLNDEAETADNVVNACSSQGDAVVAAVVAARVDTIVDTAGKDNKKSASGVPSITTEGDDGAAGVDTVVDTVGKDNKKFASGVPSITEGDVGAVAGVDTIVVVGKDNKKSTSGVPSITEGDTGAATDDYRKKLCSHSALGQPKVPHPTKKPCKKDNKLVPPANKKEDTVLLKATENVKGDVVVDQADAMVQQIRNKEFIVNCKKSHSCGDTDQLEVSCSTKMPNFPQQLSGERACKKKLLVLDINGILADIVPACGKFMGQVIINKKAVCMRPYCDDFLKFCFERFNVGVWSSRDRKNLIPIVNYLFKDFVKKLLFILDNSHCTRTGYYTIENNKKPIVLKELKKLWENLVPDLPWKNGEYNETNTLLLDDSPYKALRNPVHTAVFPHSYNYNDYNKDIYLGNDGDLQRYLKDLATAENVQEYVQQHPYGEKGITQSHPDWDFYSKIIFESADTVDVVVHKV